VLKTLDILNSLGTQLMLKRPLHILGCINQMKIMKNMQGKESSRFSKGILAYLMKGGKDYYI
jgi:hypothetical protein